MVLYYSDNRIRISAVGGASPLVSRATRLATLSNCLDTPSGRPVPRARRKAGDAPQRKLGGTVTTRSDRGNGQPSPSQKGCSSQTKWQWVGLSIRLLILKLRLRYSRPPPRGGLQEDARSHAPRACSGSGSKVGAAMRPTGHAFRVPAGPGASE